MSTPSASNLVYVASATLADALFKGGVPLIEQGVVMNGVRCFVFQIRPQDVRVARKVLQGAYPR